MLTRDNTFGERALISRVELLRKLNAVDEEFDRENATDSTNASTGHASAVAACSQPQCESSRGVSVASGTDASTVSTGAGTDTDHHAALPMGQSSDSTTTSPAATASNQTIDSASMFGTVTASNHSAITAAKSGTNTAAAANTISVSAADLARHAAVHTELQLATRQARSILLSMIDRPIVIND